MQKGIKAYNKALKSYEIESLANRVAIEFVADKRFLCHYNKVENYQEYMQRAEDRICLNNYDKEVVYKRSIAILKDKYHFIIISPSPLKFLKLLSINSEKCNNSELF